MNYLLLICLVPVVTGYSYYQPNVRIPDQSNVAEEAPCKCMPYYRCDQFQWGLVNLRSNFFESSQVQSYQLRCLDRMELCCKERKVEPPKPMIKTCGHRNYKGLDFSVIGTTGTEAKFGEFPWVVGILENYIYYGAGSLIHPRVVVTAAHVAKNLSLSNLKIRAGEWDTMTDKERLRHQERSVQEVYLHEDFTHVTAGNDIALLLLEHPVQLDEHINVICMPDQDDNFSGYKQCVANGWGKSSFGPQSPFAEVLKRVDLDIADRDHCETQIRRATRRRFSMRHSTFNLHSSFICAGGVEGNDTCQGDGGAPLACPVGNDQYKLTGLVVAGVRCGLKDVPAMYTDVARFRKWVDNKMAAWGLDNAIYKTIDGKSSLILRNDV